MDADRFEDFVRSLATPPSRRAVIRALAGLVAGPFLAPLINRAGVAAKRRHRHRGRHRRRKRPDRRPEEQPCGQNQEWCAAGDFSGCCNTQTDPEGDPVEICTDCGCCESGASQCCEASVDAVCCGNNDVCCRTKNFEFPFCCAQGETCCGDVCCEAGETCCQNPDSGHGKCCPSDTTCYPGSGDDPPACCGSFSVGCHGDCCTDSPVVKCCDKSNGQTHCFAFFADCPA